MQIVTDTATLYSPEEGRTLGFTVIPACVVVNGETYRDFEDIDSDGFLKLKSDFDFLKRSGRLTPIAAKIGGLIRIVPVMTQTADWKRIEPFAIKRSRKKALEAIINHLKSLNVDENYIISIAHGGAYEKAKEVVEQIKLQFTKTAVELLSIFSVVINTVYIYLTCDSYLLFGASLIFTVIIIYRHRKNIVRIINKNENKITWM